MKKSTSGPIENEAKEQKGRFYGVLLGVSLLANLSANKGAAVTDQRGCQKVIRAGKNGIFNSASSLEELGNAKIL